MGIMLRMRTLPAGFIAPCLPTKTEKLPSGDLWLHEIKHDGFRVIARKDGDRVRLYSRPGNDFTRRFPLIVETLARLRPRQRRAYSLFLRASPHQASDGLAAVGYWRPGPDWGVLADGSRARSSWLWLSFRSGTRGNQKRCPIGPGDPSKFNGAGTPPQPSQGDAYGVRASMSVESSMARNLPTCQASYRRSSISSSIGRPPRHSALTYRRPSLALADEVIE